MPIWSRRSASGTSRPSFNEGEYASLMEDLRARGDRLNAESRNLMKLETQVKTMIEEIERREKAVIDKQEDLSVRERKLVLDERLVNLAKQKQDRELTELEAAHNKQNAKWFNAMAPEEAAAKLMAKSENETKEEADERYLQAAKLLSLMDPEQAAQVIAVLDPVDWVEIEERKRSLPLPARKKK